MYDTRFILRCPNAACGQHVRVPTNLGALTVTCPECRQRWDWDPRADFRWPSQPRRWSRRRWIVVGVTVFVVAALVGLAWHVGDQLSKVIDWQNRLAKAEAAFQRGNFGAAEN